ncbi:MAG: hypothetical protein KGS73_05415, partial [Chloroflexi bacterium]|nr:hypothetical protein [Chloroflexota bacterium]
MVSYRIWLATMLLALLVGVLPPSPAAAVFYQPLAEEAVAPPARSTQSTTRSKTDAGVAQAPTALPKAASGSQAGGFTTQNIADFAATPISGRVFHDFNYDGLLTASGVVTDAGVSGVLVTAYNTSGAVGSATTDASGNYTINSSGNGPYRVEFSNLPDSYAPTTVNTRFITTAAGAVNVNLGINHPCDYCQDNPLVAQPIWMNGDPLVSGNLATGIWWKAFNYNNTGSQAVQHSITGSNVGALWGQAWQRSTKQLYASASVRRHAGLGPLGLGGIYRFDFSSGTPTVSPFLDLDAAPFNINFGTLPANGSGGRGLPNNIGTPSFDTDAFSAVGKQGIGDIDITEDEKTLFVVNLHTRSLIALDVTAGATPTTHQSYNIIGAPGVPTCTNGELRPWALTFYRGSGYLGAVCDAGSNSGTTNDLQGYILRFDPANLSAGYTTALSIPLNYTKGAANGPGTPGNVGYGKEWNPWRDEWSNGPGYLHVGGTGAQVITATSIIIVRPTPILMDIEFDDNGDMAIALGDRMAMQTGSDNAWPSSVTAYLIAGFVGGDLLKACHSHGANFVGTPTSGWTLESNGTCGGVTSIRNPSPLPYNTNPTIQGIGGREFYQDNSAVGDHEEALVGGLATWPGRRELIYSAYDTLFAGNGGIHYNRTTDGYLVRGYLTYPSGSGSATGYMGKAVGVGDLEVLCDPAPLQIGNRVWDDLDGDGVQDPNEPGLSGLTVSLQGPTGTVTATTDANGQYTFTNLAPNTAYTLGMAVPSGYNVPPANAAVLPGATVTSNDPISDTRDSDATLAGSTAQIAYTTGGAGQNNYGLTFGFTTQTQAQFGDRVWVESDTDGLANTGVITPVAGMVITATSGSAVYTTTTDAQGYYSFTVSAGTYTVTYGSVPSSYGSVVPSSTPGGSSESGNEGSYQQSGNPDQSHQNSTTVTVASGEANWTIDFAFNLPSAPLAQFGDRVWVESDTDGLANTGVITPVAGMVITATSGSAVYTTTTDAQG